MNTNDRPQKNRRKGAKRVLLVILLLCCLGGAAVLARLALEEIREREQGNGFYAALAGQAGAGRQAGTPSEAARGHTGAPESGGMPVPESTPGSGGTPVPEGTPGSGGTPVPESTPESEGTPVPESTPVPSPTPPASEMDFDALRAMYPDLVGWLYLEDSVIDYPVMQGEDNLYYLYHLPDGTENQNGTIMMDAANDGLFTDAVNILHGHHMRGGAMFGRLEEYKKAAYYQTHPAFTLYTPQGDYDVAVFAAYVVNGYTYGYPTSFQDEAAFELFIRQAVSSTPYETGVQVTFEDRILMLSTCDYTFRGARFVVLGKMTERTRSPIAAP